MHDKTFLALRNLIETESALLMPNNQKPPNSWVLK